MCSRGSQPELIFDATPSWASWDGSRERPCFSLSRLLLPSACLCAAGAQLLEATVAMLHSGAVDISVGPVYPEPRGTSAQIVKVWEVKRSVPDIDGLLFS